MRCYQTSSAAEGSIITTIAWDGNILATDSQITMGDEKTRAGVESKIYVVAQMAIATMGYDSECERFIDWVENEGCKPKKFPKVSDNFRGFLLNSDGLYCFSKAGKGLGMRERLFPSAWGSGADFARGAMTAGCNAYEAIDVTIKWCLFTGPPIVSITQDVLQQSPIDYRGLWNNDHCINRPKKKRKKPSRKNT